jgi:hypothetical protein
MYISEEDEKEYLTKLKGLSVHERDEYVKLVLTKLKSEEQLEQVKQYLLKIFLKIDLEKSVLKN